MSCQRIAPWKDGLSCSSQEHFSLFPSRFVFCPWQWCRLRPHEGPFHPKAKPMRNCEPNSRENGDTCPTLSLTCEYPQTGAIPVFLWPLTLPPLLSLPSLLFPRTGKPGRGKCRSTQGWMHGPVIVPPPVRTHGTWAVATSVRQAASGTGAACSAVRHGDRRRVGDAK